MTKRQRIIDIALSQFGIREIAGSKDNPEVLKYFDALGFDSATLKDETAWCSAFVNWVCIQAKAPYSERLNARSWLGVGEETLKPDRGDVVILWRENRDSWKGHVGIFIRQTKSWVYMLGGNQGNKVCIKAYNKSRVLGYRTL